MAIKISVINQKGGVGKTTTAVNLGAYLSRSGYRALVLDLDPQGNSTSGLGFDQENLDRCVYDVLINSEHPHNVIVKTEHHDYLHLLPASLNLAAAEVELVPQLAREYKLRKSLENINDDFDFIIIDNPPSLGLLTVNGLVAADYVLIPVQAEYYALEGLSQLLSTVKKVRFHLNPDLGLLGVLVTMYDKRNSLSKEVHKELKKHFGSHVFDTLIPRNVRLAEAPSHGKPIMYYDKFSKGSQSYKSLAKEIIERLNRKND